MKKYPISTKVSKPMKNEILELVRSGEYRSVSDFLRQSAYKLLEEKASEQEDVLKEKSLKRFIEKLS